MIVGPWYEYYFSVSGTEKQFMAGLIDYLHDLSDKIVCTSDIDEEFDESDLTHVPVFNFTIDGVFNFSLRRGTSLTDVPLGTAAKGYTGVYGISSINLNFALNSEIAYDTPATRAYYISSLMGIDFVNLLINTSERAWNNQLYSYNLHVIYAKGGKTSYAYGGINTDRSARANIFNISSRVFSEVDNSSNSGTFVSRFAYAAPAGKIDYIKNAAYVNTGIKVFDIPSIYDCTTQVLEDNVSLDDGRYIAVGPHQLVKIENP